MFRYESFSSLSIVEYSYLIDAGGSFIKFDTISNQLHLPKSYATMSFADIIEINLPLRIPSDVRRVLLQFGSFSISYFLLNYCSGGLPILSKYVGCIFVSLFDLYRGLSGDFALCFGDLSLVFESFRSETVDKHESIYSI